MIKRFLIIVSFVALFFATPTAVLAQPQSNPDPLSSLWTEIVEVISSIANTLFNFIIKPFFIPATINNSNTNTNFNQPDKDMTTRAIPDSNREYNMGLYLNDVINGQLEDKTISYACNNSCSASKIDSNCTDIKLSTLAYYFYKKGDKKLYQSGSTVPINYNSSKMESYKYTLVSDSSCYENLYNNSSIIPSGNYQGGNAAVSSEQLNNVVRTPIPDSTQVSPTGDSLFDKIKALIEGTNQNQNLLYRNIIPQNSQNANFSTTTLQAIFAAFLTPEDELSEPPGRTDSDLESGDWEIGGHCSSSRDPTTCNANGSHCRGLSQYGALGMAQSGMNYEEILKFYYGNITLKTIDSPNMMVQIKLDDDDSCPDGSILNVEDYLKGIGEMPNYWGSSKTGGFEALKAQAVIARTYAYVHTSKFTKPICNSSKCQVFHCSAINSKPNFTRAVEETTGQIIVDAATETVFNTEYARSFCGPSRTVTCTNHTNPSVDGYQYELKANHGNPPHCKSTTNL